MHYKFLVIACLMGFSIVHADPTARTYCFAAMESNFSDSLIDFLAKYFDSTFFENWGLIYSKEGL